MSNHSDADLPASGQPLAPATQVSPTLEQVDARREPVWQPQPQQAPSARACLMTDAELIEQFLAERCNSSETETHYRAQLRRLGWFCRLHGMRSVRDLRRDQWSIYRDYLRDPPADHISPRPDGQDLGASPPYGHPDWRPFRKSLSDRSVAQAMTVGRGFYAWMADDAIGAIPFNPISSVKTRGPRTSATKQGVKRFLNEAEMAYVQQAIATTPVDTEEQRRKKARWEWILLLAVRSGLRASEIARARADMIKAGIRPGTWTLSITRKGNVEADLPLSPDLVPAYRAYLAVYRLDMRHRPAPPLVLPVRISDRTLMETEIESPTRNHLWRIFKELTTAASQIADAAGDLSSSERLSQASTHWARHTFATDLINSGVDIRTTQELLDHSSISTTVIYTHNTDEKLRAALDKLPGL